MKCFHHGNTVNLCWPLAPGAYLQRAGLQAWGPRPLLRSLSASFHPGCDGDHNTLPACSKSLFRLICLLFVSPLQCLLDENPKQLTTGPLLLRSVTYTYHPDCPPSCALKSHLIAYFLSWQNYMRTHLHLSSLSPSPPFLFFLSCIQPLFISQMSLYLSLRIFIKCYWPIRMKERLTAWQFLKG